MRLIKPLISTHLALVLAAASSGTFAAPVNIADTGQNRCYSNSRAIPCPRTGEAFYGQDAQYSGQQPSYRDNRDGTVTDLVTGLMWSQAVSPDKVGLDQAQQIADTMSLGGYHDWRVPNIKELYSLIDFRGYTGSSQRRMSGQQDRVPFNAIPFINTDYFSFLYGGNGERYIDAQWLSSTRYASTTMHGDETLFGVNFADGRIKGYGYRKHGTSIEHKAFYVRYVRGKAYGDNHFVDNGNGTITDKASGLTWAQRDSGLAMNWKSALQYAERLEFAGYDDWRLPNAKELQSIVDYNRSPDSSNSAAIDPLFKVTPIRNEGGQQDFPAYWTSTTHLDGPDPGRQAVYISFGRAIGQINGKIVDAHGAGAQRSDPKTGRAAIGKGPQGDAVRVKNFVRVVRGGLKTEALPRQTTNRNGYPYSISLGNKASFVKGQHPMDKRPPRSNLPAEFGKHFVSRLDWDGDGRVSRQEFDGPAHRFDYHDENRDGYLTHEEAPLPPHMRRLRQESGQLR
ncbi:Lcl domain-containing protein [Marinobacterium jannaschii]|uniref:Lcl domain-containing protein n=1 Tax=Marinobacterium jannaschii TaxID=64970 RepID=UPI000A06145E|nr:DUF1566 domain-containing protein [Marinobacterium jannaschii]